MGQSRSTTRTMATTPPPTRYLCDSSSMTRCLHGGTCYYDQLNSRPYCICPSPYTGLICEKFDDDAFEQSESYES
uniref:EGF-like domain-containing protein n=1 Tax=Macrostomum lignano TaxID=282301 RepID=A0A1I8GZ75_9PLAT